MKRSLSILTLVVVLMLGTTVILSAQDLSLTFAGRTGASSSYGEWKAAGGRLYQNDTEEPLAKINFRVPQSGEMEYTFDVRYEGGGVEDLEAGFGIQIFADRVHNGRSWGNGKSWLLWLNYDEETTYGGEGFRAQVYQSTSHTKMELLKDYDVPLNDAALTTANLNTIVPAKIVVNGNTGEVKVWDPTVQNRYYKFYLPEAPGKGSYVSLRTNSLAASFDNVAVKKLR